MILALTLAIFQGGQESDDSPAAAQLRGLQQEMVSNLRDYRAARDRAKTNGEQKKIAAEYRERANAVADRALELARRYPDDPASFDALIFVVDEVRYGAGRALWALAHDYIESERLVESCRRASQAPIKDSIAAEELLRAALERSPHRKVRGFACFYLAENLKERAETMRKFMVQPDQAELFKDLYQFEDEEFARFRARGSDDLTVEAERLYEMIIARYHDLDTLRTPSLGQIAEGELFDLRHLSIGKKAPEVEGQDVDGRPLKLSDYRGKVVVVTFSGNWCGSCRAMYPKERELVERLMGRPFALLSVTNDEHKETLHEAIKSGEITWRCLWDQGRDGPVSLRWGINSWPTIFVLDGEGVIRYKNVRGDDLDKAVMSLLDETPAEIPFRR